jgi:lysophospholipase L1-like esterase
METVIRSIKKHVPNAVIIFPALPVQMFHKNSVVNILPLSVFLDFVAGYWDSQKKRLADKSSDVEYFGLTPREILSWYQKDYDDKSEDEFLIAPDGVHPNKRCYSKWAETISTKFCDHIIDCSLNNRHEQ